MKFNLVKYSRGQQIVFVVLACFIIGCFVANWGVKRFYDTKRESVFSVDSALLADIVAFENGLDSMEWSRKREFTPRKTIEIRAREEFEFDPNNIDSIDILRLGFQPYMAHNWLQYRRHGGKIYSIKKLRSIYGIDTLLVDSLKEYISFESVVSAEKFDSVKYVRKEFFAFELNSADTTLLAKLPGIGNGRAKMIVNRRNELGGFYSAEQLREIENIPDSIVDALIPFISIELDSLKRIDINKASIKRLHRHPYIDYYQAKAIYDLRWDKQHKGAIRNMEEIRKLKEFENDEEFERVKWYLRIEN
jgi:DNA uptake protein ComE-like DNA-binding protein